jgi:DNA-binding transcriptional LysR family regulator
LNLSSLDIFLAVADHCSVTRAAEAIGRAPSNVTIRIQQLEEDLGVSLFSRNGKKMTLTREGKVFLSYANRLIGLAQEARHAVKPAGPSGTLRVGTMESTAASRLPDVLARFNALWPSVSLRLTMGATRDLTRGVLAEELDCALIARPPHSLKSDKDALDPDLEQLEAQRIYVEDLVLVLPMNHPGIRSAADLQVDALAALEPGCTYRRIAEDWARKSASLPTLELGSYHAILASVTAGNAIGVMPKSVLDLMHWPSEIHTHDLGKVETLLVRRKVDRSMAFDAFFDVLTRPTPGRVHPAATG